MTATFSLRHIFRRFKGKIVITFALLLLENLVAVLQPLVIGIAINDLLAQSLRGTAFFVGLYVSGLVIGVGRRMYDTRAYTSVYTAVASDTVEHQREQGVSTSAIVTRSNLVRELVDFFEHDLPQGFTSTIGVLGATVMLAVFDWRLFAGCLVAMGVIYLIYRLSEKRIFRFNQHLNDELEQQVDVITRSPRPLIFAHFKTLARWRVKLSDTESVNFGLIDLALFALVIFALFVSVQGANPTPGGIFSVLAYVLEFAEGVYVLPIIFQQMIRLREISQRLQAV